MSVKLGLDAKLYRNTGNYASPTWAEIEDVKDLSLNLEKGEADVTTRGNSGWRATQGTLKDASVEFGLHVNTDRSDSNTDMVAFRDAWLNNTNIECLVADGVHNTTGTQGLRANFQVTKFSRTEELENGIRYDVTMKPSLAANAPSWLTV